MQLLRINTQPTKQDLRVFAAVWMVFFSGIGAIAWHKGNHTWAAVAWTASLSVSLPGLAFPRSIRAIYLLSIYVTYPFGIVSSYAILAVVYYLLFVPIGVIQRLFGRDPLNRKFDPKLESYWVPSTGRTDSESYFHQY